MQSGKRKDHHSRSEDCIEKAKQGLQSTVVGDGTWTPQWSGLYCEDTCLVSYQYQLIYSGREHHPWGQTGTRE